ncbi:T9SS type A sorting domain-containing protein [candidate division GN15 bacterium]|nr:T9SS type A sorting domain-containing protein [candidate division GN15 bacterium]
MIKVRRVLLAMLAAVCLCAVSAEAYDFQLMHEEQIDGAEYYQSIDPIIDDEGALVGLLYVEDLASNYLVLHKFDEDTLRRFEDEWMLPSAAGFVVGDTVRAFVLGGQYGYFGDMPLLYRVDFGPNTVTTMSQSLGQTNCTYPTNCGFTCSGPSLYWLWDVEGNRILGCSIECTEADKLMPSVSYTRHYSITKLYNPEDLTGIWSADVHRVGSGELASTEGYEYASISNRERRDYLQQEPADISTSFRVSDADLEGVYSVHNNDQYSTHVYVGDYISSLSGDEIIYRGSMDAIRPDNCSDTYYIACYHMVSDTPQVVWCLDIDGNPVYVSESMGVLAIEHGAGLRMIDITSGVLLSEIDLPTLACGEYFEVDGGLLHVAGRVHDTVRVYALDIATDVPGEQTLERPEGFVLNQNYPNPFNLSTTIAYSLDRSTHVRLDVVNVLGQTVQTLVDEVQAADEYQIKWNGTNVAGRHVASGVYLYRLTTEHGSVTKRMLLLK